MISKNKDARELLLKLREDIRNKRCRNRTYSKIEMQMLYGTADNPEIPLKYKSAFVDIKEKVKNPTFKIAAKELKIKRHIKIKDKKDFTYTKEELKVEEVDIKVKEDKKNGK